MPSTYVQYRGDGSNRNFAVTFPYLARDHVKVTLDAGTLPGFTWLTDSMIQLASAPGNDVLVDIRRQTPRGTPVDFEDGSVLAETDLDLLATYTAYLSEEARDGSEDSLKKNLVGQFDGRGLRVANLADAEAPSDAATKAQLDVVKSATLSEVTPLMQRAENAADSAEADRAQVQTIATQFGNVATAVGQAQASASAAAASESNTTLREAAAAVSAASAKLSADNALIQAGTYPDEPTGRAAVADGQYFKVQGVGDVSAFEYRRVNSTTSIPVTSYASSNAVTKAVLASMVVRQDLADMGSANYDGTGTIVPIVIDSENKALIWVDKDKRGIGAAGLVDDATARALGTVASSAQISVLNGVEFVGDGAIVPLLLDANNKVLFGFDKINEKIVGAIDGGASSAIVRVPQEPLAEPPAVAQINHALAAGQSLAVGAMGTPPLSTAQPHQHLTFIAGPKASKAGNGFGAVNPGVDAWKPLAEDTSAADGGAGRGETTCSGTANFFSEFAAVENGVAPSDFVIFGSTAGKGGASITELELGAPWFQMIRDHIDAAHSLSIAAGKTYAVTAMPFIQGEANVNVPMAGSAWRSKVAKLQDDVTAYAQSVSGQTAPVYFILYQTAWKVATYKDIALAQLDLCKRDPHFVMASPCYHLDFASDQIHLRNTGYIKLSRYIARALKTIAIDKKRPRFVTMKSATVRGSKLSIKYDAPVLPLMLDTLNLAATTDYGFKVQDDSGAVGVADISVENGDTVTMTLSRALSANPKARYALDYLGAGLTITNGASGNLRDSEPDSFVLSGVTHKCFNVGVHEEMPIITLP